MYRLNKKPVLYNNKYYNAVSIYPHPLSTSSPLFNISKRITGQKLSEHSEKTYTCDSIIMNPDCLSEILDYNELDILINYLFKNNLTIDYKISKLIKKDNQELIFYIN